MTDRTTPTDFPHSMADSQFLATQLQREIQQMGRARREMDRRARRDMNMWRHTPLSAYATRDGGMDTMMSGMLAGLVVDGFFGGLPMSDMMKSLAQFGAMNAQEDYNDSNASPEAYFAAQQKEMRRKMQKQKGPVAFDELTAMMQQEEALDTVLAEQSQVQQLEMLKYMAMMLMMQIMQQERALQTPKSDHGMATDVLRHPKMARFKQNRQSVSCIRTLFQREMRHVAPRMNAPKCTLAA